MLSCWVMSGGDKSSGRAGWHVPGPGLPRRYAVLGGVKAALLRYSTPFSRPEPSIWATTCKAGRAGGKRTPLVGLCCACTWWPHAGRTSVA